MKKVLALVVAFALCFTALAGCFVTSAADAAFTVVASDVTADGGAATITIAGNYPAKTVQLLTVTIPNDLTFDSVKDMTEYDETSDEDFGYVKTTTETATVIKFLEVYTGDFAIVINVTAPANDDETVDTYTINASADVAGWDATEVTPVSAVGTLTVPAKAVEPEVPVCEHENTEFYYDETHEPVPAQGTKSGETAKGKAFFKCVDCNEIIEEELSYFYYYTTGTTNAALESEILFNFKAQKAHFDRQGAFEDAYIVLDTVKHEEDGGAIRVVTNYADADFDGTYYTVTMGIAGKEMTTAMTSTVYVKYDGKWWSGLQSNKKFVDYATNRFSKSTDNDEKTLLANMLQYGADCQRYFNNGYKLDDLATDYLGDYASLVNTEVPTINEATVNELANTPSAERSHVGYHLSSLELGSIIKIKFGFRTDFYKGEEALGDITAVCSYLDADNATQSKYYTKDAEENGYGFISGYTNRYEFWYDGIAAKDMRKTVTATLENASGTIGYKMETSIAAVAGALRTKNASNTNLVAVINSMINYGDAANTYFYK